MTDEGDHMTNGDDDWEPSAKEKDQMEKFYQLAERHPTFLLLMKIVHGRSRLKELLALRGPEAVVQNERKMLDRRLDELCAAMPYLPEQDTFSLPDIIEHFRRELREAPGKGDDA